MEGWRASWRSTSARFRTQELIETPNLARHCSLQLDSQVMHECLFLIIIVLVHHRRIQGGFSIVLKTPLFRIEMGVVWGVVNILTIKKKQPPLRSAPVHYVVASYLTVFF